ncbi:universal stress protein [Desulforamulus aeronauticus]|uniref:Nucleotide-binding universal stress protein, UspA family n=1 Tax=Desulforamulus aeronauticus DSM 10349 TaxID=1121421 RepID=A0A1M6QU52_9FIRM|nr:universal stress protein [Desulforamulus aeronauticus]SHK23547.1 Nucleotide-binding universal stress protein, UspA family [Desulforamulus aeronauticus DSM 10349]
MFKYLLAVDESENAARAAQYLANLAGIWQDLDITVVHVVNFKKEIHKMANSSTEIPEIEKEVIAQGWQVLNEQTVAFDKFGVTIKKQLINGHPSDKITEFAKLNDFTHIVLGSRGLTDLQGLVMGSVSHRVLHQAHCPVTLVK